MRAGGDHAHRPRSRPPPPPSGPPFSHLTLCACLLIPLSLSLWEVSVGAFHCTTPAQGHFWVAPHLFSSLSLSMYISFLFLFIGFLVAAAVVVVPSESGIAVDVHTKTRRFFCPRRPPLSFLSSPAPSRVDALPFRGCFVFFRFFFWFPFFASFSSKKNRLFSLGHDCAHRQRWRRRPSVRPPQTGRQSGPMCPIAGTRIGPPGQTRPPARSPSTRHRPGRGRSQ